MAPRSVLVYGKEGWPYTSEAREAYAAKGYRVDYRNVKKSAPDLDEMLVHSKGARKVPVIVEDGRVTIGFGGTW